MKNVFRHPAASEAIVGTTLIVLLPEWALKGTVLHDDQASILARLGAVSLEWLLVFVVLVLGLTGVRAKRRAVALIAAVLLALWLWLYLLSWGLFFGVEYFINVASLRMGSASFTLLLKHFLEFSPGVFIVSCLLGPLLVAAAFWWTVRSRDTASYRADRWNWVVLSLASVVALAALFSAHLSLKTVHDRATGTVRLAAQHYSWVLRTRSGPMLHVALEFLAPLDKGPWELRDAPYPAHSEPRSAGKAYQSEVPTSARKFNVILLLVESLRRDALRSLGGRRSVMPHLDSLALKSQVFSRAYAQATHSDYADVSALSSQFPIRYRVHTEYAKSPPYPRELLHDVLKPRGYRTAIISSQNEHWANMYDFLKTPALDYFLHAENHRDAYMPEGDAGFADWAETWKRSGKLDDKVTIDEVIRWIAKDEKPFSLYVNLQNSHFPYRFPEGMPFQPSEIDFPFTFARYPKDKKHVVENRYHNALHYMDQQIGRLIEYLKTSGKLERTLILVSGDTGQGFYEHGFVAHGRSAFEEFAGIPLVIYVPGAEPGTYDVLTSQVDYVPTLLALLGMPPHPGHQGRSVFEVVDSEPEKLSIDEGGAPRVVFTGRQLPGVQEITVVQGRHKLFLMDDGSTLLFDMENDPGERHNLSEKLPQVREALKHAALSYRKVQVDYYTSPGRMAKEYPPRLVLPGRTE